MFTLAKDGTGFSLLKSFDGCSTLTDGCNPFAGLIEGSDGKLYGTMQTGGLYGAGTVYRFERSNHSPVANAGLDQTVNEGTLVTLNGSGSSDPDGDPLTYSWTQISGPAVLLSSASSPTPIFTAPTVGPGGAALKFSLTVSDTVATNSSEVAVTVLNVNDPPVCNLARASVSVLWPPNHVLVPVSILGVTDPNNDGIAIAITRVTQDERVNGLGDGDTSPDAVIQNGQVLVRAERAGNGNGRVYQIQFTADDGQGGSCTGSVNVRVPLNMKKGSTAVDSGQLYDSTLP